MKINQTTIVHETADSSKHICNDVKIVMYTLNVKIKIGGASGHGGHVCGYYRPVESKVVIRNNINF